MVRWVYSASYQTFRGITVKGCSFWDTQKTALQIREGAPSISFIASFWRTSRPENRPVGSAHGSTGDSKMTLQTVGTNRQVLTKQWDWSDFGINVIKILRSIHQNLYQNSKCKQKQLVVEPTHLKKYESKWVHLPQFSGWKIQKYLSYHPLMDDLPKKNPHGHETENLVAGLQLSPSTHRRSNALKSRNPRLDAPGFFFVGEFPNRNNGIHTPDI